MAHDIDITHQQPMEPKKKSSSLHPTKNHKKKYHDWLSDPYNPTRGEMGLWVAVITQAMQDALTRAGNAEAMYHKHEATHWLTSNSSDFKTVCLYAGLDPDYVRRMAKRTLGNPNRWRAEAGKGARYLERKEYRKRMKAKRKSVLTREPRLPQEHPALVISPWVSI